MLCSEKGTDYSLEIRGERCFRSPFALFRISHACCLDNRRTQAQHLSQLPSPNPRTILRLLPDKRHREVPPPKNRLPTPRNVIRDSTRLVLSCGFFSPASLSYRCKKKALIKSPSFGFYFSNQVAPTLAELSDLCFAEKYKGRLSILIMKLRDRGGVFCTGATLADRVEGITMDAG